MGTHIYLYLPYISCRICLEIKIGGTMIKNIIEHFEFLIILDSKQNLAVTLVTAATSAMQGDQLWEGSM